MISKSLLSKVLVFFTMALIVNQIACSNAGFGSNDGDKNNKRVDTFGFDDNKDIGLITIDDRDGDGPLEWSRDYRNIYYNIRVFARGECVDGLRTSADDQYYDDQVERLQAIMGRSKEVRGTGSDFALGENNTPYIRVSGDDGTETFYLVDKRDIPSSEKSLSNRDEILDFYDDMIADIKRRGESYCPGKGQVIN